MYWFEMHRGETQSDVHGWHSNYNQLLPGAQFTRVAVLIYFDGMLTYVAQALYITSMVLLAHASPTWAVVPFFGLEAATEAAADLCNLDTASDESDLAIKLQDLVQGNVLTCKTSEAAFVDATTAFWASGYPADAGIKPAVIVQPSGKLETTCM